MEPRITLTMSSVGQITIPRSVRKLLNLEIGTKFDFEVNQKNKTLTLTKQPTVDEVMDMLDEIDKKYPTPKPDPRAKHMTVGEMSLEMSKNIKGDTWV
jgi:AbrB family looped-hinge helix DNA binding protein